MSISEYLENILTQCGGFGLFQVILFTVVMGSKLPVAWSMMMMTYAGVIPDWWCDYDQSKNSTGVSVTGSPFTNSSFQQCTPTDNGSHTSCIRHQFSNKLSNIVDEVSIITLQYTYRDIFIHNDNSFAHLMCKCCIFF